jgi:hypothetical protein
VTAATIEQPVTQVQAMTSPACREGDDHEWLVIGSSAVCVKGGELGFVAVQEEAA